VRTRRWETPASRRGGVSSFGFGGVNAHVLLEEAPAAAIGVRTGERPAIFPLSARSAASLRRAAEKLGGWIDSNSGSVDLNSIAAALQLGREQFAHRLAIVASSAEELRRAIGLWLSGEHPRGLTPAFIERGNSARRTETARVSKRTFFTGESDVRLAYARGSVASFRRER